MVRQFGVGYSVWVCGESSVGVRHRWGEGIVLWREERKEWDGWIIRGKKTVAAVRRRGVRTDVCASNKNRGVLSVYSKKYCEAVSAMNPRKEAPCSWAALLADVLHPRRIPVLWNGKMLCVSPSCAHSPEWGLHSRVDANFGK